MVSNGRPFSRVLIANRGEIACRIISTLSKMDISSVAIYHESDADTLHCRMADKAVEISGATPVGAYLDGEQIIMRAQQMGAEAIHPGYGFLSENAQFARAVRAAGLVFIGPAGETIDLMGDKIKSRAFAEKHGVPVAPSVLPTGDMKAFLKQAEKIGFPLLIKASAGGGGKGMSIVREAGELAEAARVAASEAERYFADNRIFAELYVEQPRHIEVQVFGDGTGNVVHMFERECSIQRRFQKIIEEAPAAGLPEKLRSEIHDAALKLARAAKYKNAGTVEFIVSPDGKFYFLEMNTRLQVEHPVSEMITGLDLVQLQVEIAGGAKLPLAQSDIKLKGHSFECRLTAEDPANDFLPEVGKILALIPPSGDHIRFENGITQGQDITTNYDPMLAKLVVHGDDRMDAIEKMRDALSDMILLGVETNLDYLRTIIEHPAFQKGALHTGFIKQFESDLLPAPPSGELSAAAILAAAFNIREFHELVYHIPEPYASIGGWRN